MNEFFLVLLFLSFFLWLGFELDTIGKPIPVNPSFEDWGAMVCMAAFLVAGLWFSFQFVVWLILLVAS